MNNKLTKDNWIKAFEMEMVKICDWFYTDKTVRKSILKATQSQIDLAIEKTNKRWREKLNAIADGAVGLTKDTSGNDREYLWYDDVQKVISDLLEDKK